MNDYITVIHYQPAIAGFSLFATFLFVLFAGAFQYSFGQGVQHTIAGAIAKDKIVGERGNVLDVEQQDVFTLFLFQGMYNGASQFKCVQMSPQVCNGAENKGV